MALLLVQTNLIIMPETIFREHLGPEVMCTNNVSVGVKGPKIRNPVKSNSRILYLNQ